LKLALVLSRRAAGARGEVEPAFPLLADLLLEGGQGLPDLLQARVHQRELVHGGVASHLATQGDQALHGVGQPGLGVAVLVQGVLVAAEVEERVGEQEEHLVFFGFRKGSSGHLNRLATKEFSDYCYGWWNQ